MLSLLQEKRPLKRTRLGPPDVYPQDAKQREDELTPSNVKHGFATMPPLADEFGTAHTSNVNASKVASFFNAILAKKEELMTLQDTMRKKQQINCKDNFWPVSPRTKGALDAWFKDLAGNKPLLSLAKRVPSFNKKEEILITLCDHQVNMQRATWFIKLSAAYMVSVSESKNKKRNSFDPVPEWTSNLIKFMKDLLPKLQEYYHLSEKSSAAEKALLSGYGAPSTQNNNQQQNTSTTHPTNSLNTVPQSLASPVPMLSPANSQSSSGGGLSTLAGNSTPGVGTSNSQSGLPGANNMPGSGSSISGIGSNFEDSRNALKYWNYCTQLSKYMHEESLLDRQEFLNWILELLDKMRTQVTFDESLKKLILTFALQYMHDFVQSERLCRKMAYVVAKKLANLLNNVIDQQPNGKQLLPAGVTHMDIEEEVDKKKPALDPYESAINEYLNCPHHRDIILYLSTILQIITIECPTAMVWCGIGENRIPAALCGSPLDHLPIAPSALPMPTKCTITNAEVRRQLRATEAEIVLRSKHAENRWFAEKWQNANKNSYTHVLTILDHLDTHCFDLMDQSNSIDSLYGSIFQPFVSVRREMGANGETKEIRQEYDSNTVDGTTVKILCEWAVSSQRWGEHRAIVVAILLDKRQIEVTTPSAEDNNNGLGNSNNPNDDKDSIASGAGLIGGLPVFQSVLMNFLDHDAPVLDENGSVANRTQFTNLVHLFSALIRHDVFSHNAYMHTLISRGDLLEGASTTATTTNVANSLNNNNSKGNNIVTGPVSNKPVSPAVNHGFDDEFGAGLDFKHNEFDDSNVDDDLDKLLQNIKEKGQAEAPDSPKIPDHNNSTGCNENNSSISRHYIYTKHFPIPQDDPSMIYSSESNQRYILLFGVGKERDEKKHAVKKMSKEICKLFTKKFSIDVAEGGKVKKHSRNEFNFENTTSKCQNMAYFDQHVVTSQCAATVLEQLNGFAVGNNNYLPVQEHVAFLFDLMEMALNIHSLLELCDQILKELPEVENQLLAKKSNMVRSYTTSLGLYIVGILRRYQSCLLLSPEQTVSVFEGLCRIIKHVNNPTECSSAERCILAYLSDLYESYLILRSKDQEPEFFPQMSHIKKFKDIFNQPEQLGMVPQSYNPQFMQEFLASPKRGGKIDNLWLRQLHESPANIYSFVSNVIFAVCHETDNDRLNDIAIACAELTAGCNSLSEEWIAALQSICHAMKKTRYPHLCQIDIQNSKIHNSLAVFICILVARHCFSLADFVLKIALPTLANAYPVGGEITTDAESGARLTCHLVLKLFKTIEIPQPGMYSVSTSPNPLNAVSGSSNIKLSCDRHLLIAAHKNIQLEAVLAVLKAILIVVDTTALKTPTMTGNTSTGAFGSGGKRGSGFNTPVHPGSTPKSNDRPVDISQILGTSDLTNLTGDHDHDMSQSLSTTPLNPSVTGSGEQISLLEFAQHVLKQICAQEHVLERCLKNADKLCDMIIDDMLTPKQSQSILHMICYSEVEYSIISEMDQKSMIVRILENLGQWTLRISWLDLQLMHKQSMNNGTELTAWLDTVARAAIDVFLMEEVLMPHGGKAEHRPKPSTWLVAPLVSKLTPAVQGRILRVAGQVLESMNYFSKCSKADNNSSCSGDEREKSNSCGSASSSYSNGSNCGTRNKKMPLNYQPFLGLILTCLKGQDEYKENLLVSLYSQLSQCLQSYAEFDTMGGVDDPLGREEMLDALQLRFSLVGGMFDSIQKNGTSITDWAILLAQLVCQGVVDLSTNRELFTTVVDMLTTLVHSTLVSDGQSERDEKFYSNLMKKLKKEIGEKNNASIKVIRQLLPLYKHQTEVISCEPAGVDQKGNKINDMDKKQLRISDKQRISVWDILEGHKNPAPLSWVWFGAVKLERKPLTYEEAHRNLKYHTHSLIKPSSYYYEPLPLPPEDIEPVPEKIVTPTPFLQKDEMKADTPSSVDQSPSAVVSGRGRGKGTTRKRKPKNSKTPPVNTQQQPPLVGQQTQQGAQQTANQQQQPQQQQQLGQQAQQQQQVAQQQQQINPQQQMGQMQMNMQMGSNVNMQQFNPNQMMQQNPNAMMQQQQMQGVPGNMQQQISVGNPQQNQQLNFMGPGGAQGMQQAGMNPQQQQWQGQNQFHPIQQQQQQQQFYQQQQGMQMNRFERPQINNSKQALHNMLRQRQPTFNQNNPSFNPMQQQQQRQAQGMQPQQQPGAINPVQQQQQLQQQQFGRTGMRTMAPNQMAGVAPNQMAPNMNAVGMAAQGMGAQNPMMQQQMSTQGMNPQANAQMGMNQSANMMGAGNASNPNAMMTGQSNTGMVNAGSMMQQNVGVAGVGNAAVNQGMVNTTGPGQFQNFNQYQQGMSQTGGPNQQTNLMGGFNQMNQRNNPAEFMAQQQQRGPAGPMAGNRGQYMNQAPNVTMNNMMGQGAVPPYQRQQSTGGKPGVQQQQFQQQQQQQRMQHQMMQMQGMGPQNTAAGGMGQAQNQAQQQNPNLVAQLQRQMPNQPNMMGQQYQHQPPPY
ncbi:mediator of RNA polymerase II transcription subunit 12 [Calliphora vicina]|uniref:mediator of RNA polymerase II transcription subunit 12 n=1 Tax=Calliphora vicina TaxID=7373 RepID=UPI00325B107E